MSRLARYIATVNSEEYVITKNTISILLQISKAIIFKENMKTLNTFYCQNTNYTNLIKKNN